MSCLSLTRLIDGKLKELATPSDEEVGEEDAMSKSSGVLINCSLQAVFFPLNSTVQYIDFVRSHSLFCGACSMDVPRRHFVKVVN